MDDALGLGMTSTVSEFTLSGFNGHNARLKYALADDHGWDVRAELDDRVVRVHHCSDWRGVEGLRTWLLVLLLQADRRAA